MFGLKTVKRKKVGLSPGSLVHVGEKKSDRIIIRLMHYTDREFEEKECTTIDECFPYFNADGITWVNIDGLHDVEVIKTIGENRNLHPLILEDILNTHQSTKMDELDRYLFIISRMLYFNEHTDSLESEQVSLVLGKNFVITFQERKGDVFDPVRERIRTYKGRIRKMGADYLAYALMDIIVDNYFVVIDKIEDKIEHIEDSVMTAPRPEMLETLHYLKKDIILLRKSAWPLREIIMAIERDEPGLICEATIIYFKDLYDHTLQVMEAVETFRDLVSGMQDLYLTSISNRMNEVMKVLTVIATIFIPLTFITGIYGMNFNDMPELAWPFGYPLVLMLMLIVGLLMVAYFRQKKWL
ncbi:MAG: magnesium/cobalt transporter CorA [Desulfobacterales bacterium]